MYDKCKGNVEKYKIQLVSGGPVYTDYKAVPTNKISFDSNTGWIRCLNSLQSNCPVKSNNYAVNLYAPYYNCCKDYKVNYCCAPKSISDDPKQLPSESWSDCSMKCHKDVNCKFWQYKKKLCQLIVEFHSIVPDDDYIIGSSDCPGDSKAYQSTYGQCPNTFKAKSMWKVGNETFFDKHLQITSMFI